MMVKAWSGRYGDALESEMDPMFWASKLHFYMTSPQFCNHTSNPSVACDIWA